MKRHVLLYGLLGGALIALLKLVEYRYLIVAHSLQIYGGIVALVFVGLGLWLGATLTGRPERLVVREVPGPPVPLPSTSAPSSVDSARREALGITKRELEILTLIAEGLSNREIAERIFVSENTVKTHSSRLFDKLNARRRTQAVQLAKEHGLIP
jgi:two-component system, NarL family, response regulator LiaR